MDGKKSKFDFGEFWIDGDCIFAVNSDKYTEEEAKNIYQREVECAGCQSSNISKGYVQHHAGVDEDGERQVGWWLHTERIGNGKRRCPVWVIR